LAAAAEGLRSCSSLRMQKVALCCGSWRQRLLHLYYLLGSYVDVVLSPGHRFWDAKNLFYKYCRLLD